MAKSKVMDVATAAQSGVVVKRAWFSLEIWNYAVGALVSLLGLVAFLAPNILPLIPALELSPRWALFWVVMINAALYVNGWVLKLQSRSVIGTQSDVRTAKEAVASPDEDDGEP